LAALPSGSGGLREELFFGQAGGNLLGAVEIRGIRGQELLWQEKLVIISVREAK
jgi:hypothetical protein